MISDIFMFAVIKNNHWHMGIGDPSLIGWFTVFAYFVSAFLCLRCAMPINKPMRQKKTHHIWWWFLFIIMLLLGINKQLDLQSWFTLVGKQIAQAQGWYENRRQVQVFFIASIISVAIPSLTVISQTIKFKKFSNWLSFIGLVFLSCFVVIRAASFHAIDHFIELQFLGLKMNWLLELSGIGAVSLSAYLNLRERD